jgi:hypothetical protein
MIGVLEHAMCQADLREFLHQARSTAGKAAAPLPTARRSSHGIDPPRNAASVGGIEVAGVDISPSPARSRPCVPQASAAEVRVGARPITGHCRMPASLAFFASKAQSWAERNMLRVSAGRRRRDGGGTPVKPGISLLGLCCIACGGESRPSSALPGHERQEPESGAIEPLSDPASNSGVAAGSPLEGELPSVPPCRS